MGVSRIRRTATKRRSLALAATHARTCDTGSLERPVRGELKSRKKTADRESPHLHCATQQPGWKQVYAVPVCGSLMRALPEKEGGIDAGNNVSGTRSQKDYSRSQPERA